MSDEYTNEQEQDPTQDPEAAAAPPEPEESPVLDLTTEVTEPKLIRINGDDYHLFNFDHLSPEQEAHVTATFSRFNKVFRRLEDAPNDRKTEEDAMKLRGYREKLICALTDVPQSVVKSLKADKQGALLSAIQDEIGNAGEDDDDGGDEE